MTPQETNPQDTISIEWDIDDVLEVRPDLSADQARQVLQSVKRNHDAEIGVNWDVIQCTADWVFPVTGATT